MPSAAVARRRGSAYTARVAAKERRQKISLLALTVALALVLAFELPHMLKGSGGSSSPVSGPGATPAHTARSAAKPRFGRGTGADPFAARPLPNDDARVVADGPDPFAAPARRSAVASPPSLPKQLVVGRPGGHRVARHGWIVILASIPTGSGRGAAVRFSRAARSNVGSLSILDSSNRRPLRGGYWVVYTGPYPTLSAVSRRAGDVHAAGYRTAYIRELITYR